MMFAEIFPATDAEGELAATYDTNLCDASDERRCGGLASVNTRRANKGFHSEKREMEIVEGGIQFALVAQGC